MMPAPALNADKSTWMIEAYLAAPLSSEGSKQGEAIKAVVTQPVYNADHTIAVPQGATLVGSVTRAKHSRRFGRTGVLSFNFQQLVFPEGEKTQTVETRLTGADSAANIASELGGAGEGEASGQGGDSAAAGADGVAAAGSGSGEESSCD